MHDPPNASDRLDVGRKSHPPLESNGHACSLPAVSAVGGSRPSLTGRWP
jgi:hypothetical protein